VSRRSELHDVKIARPDDTGRTGFTTTGPAMVFGSADYRDWRFRKQDAGWQGDYLPPTSKYRYSTTSFCDLL